MRNQTIAAPDLRGALSACAKELERDVERHAVATTRAIDAAIEDFDHQQSVTARTLGATRSSYHAFCALLRVTDPFDFNAPPEAVANARAFVRRGIPLRVLVRCYQVGHGEMWRAWQEVVRSRDLPVELESEVLTQGSNVLFRFIEGLVADVMHVYEREQEHWSRSMEAIREDTVKQIIAGTPMDLAKAERALAYDLRAMQVGAVMWTTDGSDRTDALWSSWRTFVAAANGRAATAIIVGSRVLWGWVAAQGDELDGLLPDAVRWAPPAGIRMALGEPDRGIDGFRSSHYQALQARRVAEMGRSPEPTVRFGDLAVPALVTADPRLAATFTARALGPLDGPDKLTAKLRTTLEAYFAERESPGATARRLDVHVNTVIYRLKQSEELLGAPPADRRLELELALMLRHYLQPQPLDE